MKAMILAAGRGERLRPLTDHKPKPLIEVGGEPLIGHHLRALARAGVTDVVINAAWLAGQLQAALGDGRGYGLRIRYSVEVAGALDTGGGVRAALPLLGPAPFLLVSADVFTDFDYARVVSSTVPEHGARIALVDNPPHHRDGDFGLQGERLTTAGSQYTYAGIGLYCPQLFAAEQRLRFPLVEVIRVAMGNGRAYGMRHGGAWIDVGRPAALQRARALAGSR